jgi:hypothetical protein
MMRLRLNAPGGGGSRRAAYAELRLNPRIRYVAAALPAAIAATCLAAAAIADGAGASFPRRPFRPKATSKSARSLKRHRMRALIRPSPGSAPHEA